MDNTETSTKEQLIHTAGELFAESGFDGVSTRTIADKAGVTLGSIHYHFGSKKELYLEAFKCAMREKRCNGFQEVLEEIPHLADKPAGQAEIIRNAVFRNFYDYFRPDKEKWTRRIILREVQSPSSAMPAIAEQVFRPDAEQALRFYKKIKPDAGDDEAYAWMDILHAQLYFYGSCGNILEQIRGKSLADSDIYLQAARSIAKAMIVMLELPLPGDLQD